MRRSFVLGLPIFCSLLMVVLYAFAVFGQLDLGFFVSCFFLVMTIPLIGYSLLFSAHREEHRTHIANATVLVFLAFAMLTLLINSGREVVSWDDFNHWATAVKEMLYTDSLASSSTSRVLFTRNNPSATIMFRYFFSRLAGGYSEFVQFASLQLLMYAFLMPLFAQIKTNTLKFYALIAGVPTILLLFQSSQHLSAFGLLGIDILMGLQFAFLLWVVMSPAPEYTVFFKGFLSALMGCSLIIQKDIGLGLVAITVGLLLLQIVCNRKSAYQSERIKGLLIQTVCLLAGAAIAYGSWQWYWMLHA